MKRIQLEFLSEGFHDLLCSEPVAEQVEKAADKVASVATSSARTTRKGEPAQFIVKGPKMGGYGGGRVIAYVAAENQAAYREAVYNHALEKAIWEAQA